MKNLMFRWKQDGRLHWKAEFPFSRPAMLSVAALAKRHHLLQKAEFAKFMKQGQSS